MNNKFVIADADILVSLFFTSDANYQSVVNLIDRAIGQGLLIKYPNTAILEAITFLRRALNKPEAAKDLNNRFLGGEFNVVYVTEEIQEEAGKIFSKTKSKKNTIFDCIVLATAKLIKADGIFSFDDWYKKMGVNSLRDLV